MVAVLNVARYIINYSNEKGCSISNLKLQKLLYFVQAYYLSFTESHNPCFEEEIEAWDFGPVVPSVYHEFKSFGGSDIPPVTNYYSIDSEDGIWSVKKVHFNEDCIDECDKELISSVVDKFAPYSASELVSLTHSQAPWRNAYQPESNNVITKDAIREYFYERSEKKSR